MTESRPSEDQRQAALDELDSFLYEAQRDVPADERLSIDDLVEMGDIMQRNEVLLHLLYTGRTPDNFTEEDIEWLRNRVPNRILTDLGLDTNTDTSTSSDISPEAAAQDARERITAINLLREIEGLDPLSQAEEDDVLKYSLGLNISDVEGMGIEAYRPYNSYRDAQEEALGEGDFDALEAANQSHVEEVLALMGRGSLEDFVDDNPLLTQFDRDIRNMREAGYTEQEIADQVVEDLSRERRAIVFGEDSLDTAFSYENYTPEELERMEIKVRNEASQMEWLWMYQFGRQPTGDEIEFYMAQVFFTAPEQVRVGVDKYTPPRRDNETPDSVYLARQAAEAQIIDQQVGTDFSSRIDQ